MKWIKYKKIVFGVLLALFFEVTNNFNAFVYAAESETARSMTDAAKEAMALGVIGYAILELAAKIMVLTAGLVDFAVRLGNDVLTLPAVQSGWQIVLSFTNLGFVLGIIVIAFATILRRESYGMKQILWKLVIAALLVNFSLVIAGAFMSFSNIVSNVFYDAALGNGGNNLTNALGNAMAPQKFLDLKDKDLLSVASDYIKDTFTITGWIKYFINIFFVIIFTFLIILAFISLFIMLLMRAITLSFLLIASPIIWLLWIFPDTSKYWKQWWQEFIRWNFFAPAVYFFIYLAVLTAAGIQESGLSSVKGAQSMANSAASVFSGSGMISNIFTHIANLFVVLGLLYGGIYVANKFGIAGGGIGVNLAQKAGKAFGGRVGGWAGRKGKQYGTGWLNKKREVAPGVEKSRAEQIAEWSSKSKLAKYTVLPGLAARGIAKFSAAGGENLVKDTKGAASKRSLNENLAMLGYADAPNRIGILQHLQEKDLLDKVPNVSKYISKGYKAEAARFGQGVGYGNIEKSLGMNTEMKEAFDKKDTKTFSAEGKKFFSKFSEKDWAKPQYNEIYKDKPSHGVSEQLHGARQEVFVASLAEINPGQLAKTMPKIKSTNFDNYEKAVNKIVTEMYKTNPEKAKKVAESFKKALGRRMLGIEWESMEPVETTEPKEEKKEDKK